MDQAGSGRSIPGAEGKSWPESWPESWPALKPWIRSTMLLRAPSRHGTRARLPEAEDAKGPAPQLCPLLLGVVVRPARGLCRHHHRSQRPRRGRFFSYGELRLDGGKELGGRRAESYDATNEDFGRRAVLLIRENSRDVILMDSTTRRDVFLRYLIVRLLDRGQPPNVLLAHHVPD